MGGILVILAILINLIVWPILGILYISSGDSSGWKYILIPLAIVLVFGIIFYIWSKGDDEKREKIKIWRDSVFSKYGIDLNEVKFNIKSMNSILVYLLYTNDKRLFVINEDKQIIKQIELNKILKVDTQANIEEKQKQQVIALTTTFYTTQKVLSYILKITTEDNTFTLVLSPTSENKECIERFKLMLERDIKNFTEIE